MKRVCAAVACLALAACSGAPEEAVLERFFGAARLHDTTALARFAIPRFEPTEQGIVTEFTITTISPAERRPVGGDRRVAEMSLDPAGAASDLARHEVGIVSRQVTLAAPVKLPDGQTRRKTFVVTLSRAVLEGRTEIAGGWIVTSIAEATDSRTAASPGRP